MMGKAEKPIEGSKLVVRATLIGHISKEIWVAQAIAGGGLFASPPIGEIKMNIVHVNDLGWWLIIFLNFVGYFILSFSSISNGTLKEVEKAIGTLLTTISFILMLIFFGFINSVILMLILWIVITPVVMILIKQLEKKLFPYRIKIRKEYARKLNVTEEEVERINQMNDIEFDEEMHKKYKWLNSKNIPDVIKQKLVKKDEK